MKRQMEFEKQIEKQRQMEMEREEQRRKAMEQREVHSRYVISVYKSSYVSINCVVLVYSLGWFWSSILTQFLYQFNSINKFKRRFLQNVPTAPYKKIKSHI